MLVKLTAIQIMHLLNLTHNQMLYLESLKDKNPATKNKIHELQELVKTLSTALAKPFEKEA